jgi:S1-C subfamily serine protease
MRAFRKTLLAAFLAVGALPGWAAAAEPAKPADQDVEKRLEEAQKRLDAAAREVAELSGQMGRRFNMRFGGDPQGPPRAMLGVAIGRDEAKDGAHVLNVSPGGPAEEAGIKVGDVITSLGGQDLTKEGDPGRALVDKLNQLDPNLKVQVGVLREGKKMNFDVTPRPAPQVMALGGRGPDGPGGVRRFEFQGPGGGAIRLPNLPNMEGGPGGQQIRQFILQRDGEGGTRFRGVEFATLSERLGSYFGVKKGVLVVRARANSPFKLQDGDVILSIDGREPESAQHAGRILRSYSNGEKLTLRIQRDRKAQTLEVTVPGGNDDED